MAFSCLTGGLTGRYVLRHMGVDGRVKPGHDVKMPF